MRSCKDHDEKTTANASPSTNEQRSDDKIDNGHAGNRAGSSNKEQGKGARKYAGQRATTRKKTFADRSQIERSIDWAAANNKRQWDNQIDRPPRSKTYRGRRRAFMSVPPRPVPTVDSSSEDGDKSDDGTGESDSDMVILSDPPKARKENDMACKCNSMGFRTSDRGPRVDGNNKSESGGAGDGSDSDVVILGDLPKAREGHSANGTSGCMVLGQSNWSSRLDVDDEANSDMVILSDSPEHRSTGEWCSLIKRSSQGLHAFRTIHRTTCTS